MIITIIKWYIMFYPIESSSIKEAISSRYFISARMTLIKFKNKIIRKAQEKRSLSYRIVFNISNFRNISFPSRSTFCNCKNTSPRYEVPEAGGKRQELWKKKIIRPSYASVGAYFCRAT